MPMSDEAIISLFGGIVIGVPSFIVSLITLYKFWLKRHNKHQSEQSLG